VDEMKRENQYNLMMGLKDCSAGDGKMEKEKEIEVPRFFRVGSNAGMRNASAEDGRLTSKENLARERGNWDCFPTQTTARWLPTACWFLAR
jgi:hypothetical protein